MKSLIVSNLGERIFERKYDPIPLSRLSELVRINGVGYRPITESDCGANTGANGKGFGKGNTCATGVKKNKVYIERNGERVYPSKAIREIFNSGTVLYRDVRNEMKAMGFAVGTHGLGEKTIKKFLKPLLNNQREKEKLLLRWGTSDQNKIEKILDSQISYIHKELLSRGIKHTASSPVSESRYYKTDSGLRIRVSGHRLPFNSRREFNRDKRGDVVNILVRRKMSISDMVDMIDSHIPGDDNTRLAESDTCGAGSPGGKGFQRGNTCAKGNVSKKNITDTHAFKKWFGDSKVVDSNGNPLVVYHGTQRPDRISGEFMPERSTSGPSAFFTEDPEIASSYATDKKDTSIVVVDMKDYFTVNGMPLDKAWKSLSAKERVRLKKLLPKVGFNFDGEFGEYPASVKSHFEFVANREKNGDYIQAAFEVWVNGGVIYGEEEKFAELLNNVGLKAEYDNPYSSYPAVIPAYLSIVNPLDTGSIPKGVVRKLEIAAEDAPAPNSTSSFSDFWDKSRRYPVDWVNQLKSDTDEGKNSFVWSSIPDFVTDTLRNSGYDGIKDTGGKLGGKGHTVWIPFDPAQIKSAIGNKGSFSKNSNRITESRIGKLIEKIDTCGAGSTGGKGFRKGNVCGKSKGKFNNQEIGNANNTKEAETHALKYGIAKKANYKKISVEYANIVNATLYRLKEKYGESFDEINSVDKVSGGYGNAPMFTKDTFERDENGNVKFSKSSLNINQGYIRTAKKQAEKLNGKWGTSIVDDMSDVEVLKESEKIYPGYLADTTIKGLVTHEYGHELTNIRHSYEEMKLDLKTDRLGGSSKISRYAGESKSELLAETFAQYHKDKSVLSDEQVDFFNRHSRVSIGGK